MANEPWCRVQRRQGTVRASRAILAFAGVGQSGHRAERAGRTSLRRCQIADGHACGADGLGSRGAVVGCRTHVQRRGTLRAEVARGAGQARADIHGAQVRVPRARGTQRRDGRHACTDGIDARARGAGESRRADIEHELGRAFVAEVAGRTGRARGQRRHAQGSVVGSYGAQERSGRACRTVGAGRTEREREREITRSNRHKENESKHGTQRERRCCRCQKSASSLPDVALFISDVHARRSAVESRNAWLARRVAQSAESARAADVGVGGEGARAVETRRAGRAG